VQWVLATHNLGKIAEFESLLSSLKIEIMPVSRWSQEEPTEDAMTFVENALIKARFAASL
jgi:XTP/dITP diphosphohydrolase